MASVSQDIFKDVDSTIPPEEIKRMIKNSVQQMGASLSKERKQELAIILKKVFVDDVPPAQALGLTKENIGEMYRYAFQEFKSGNIETAREFYKILFKLDPRNPSFSLSLGVCHHRLKRFKVAIATYLLSAWLDCTNPVPFFYAYDCFMNINDKFGAAVMLSNAIAAASDQPAYAAIKSKAQLLLNDLENYYSSIKKE